MATINIELARQQGIELEFMDGFSIVEGFAINSQIIDETGFVIFQEAKKDILDIMNFGNGKFVIRKNIKPEQMRSPDMIYTKLCAINNDNKLEVKHYWLTYHSVKTKKMPFDFINKNLVVIEELHGVYIYDLKEFRQVSESYTKIKTIEEDSINPRFKVEKNFETEDKIGYFASSVIDKTGKYLAPIQVTGDIGLTDAHSMEDVKNIVDEKENKRGTR